MLLQHHEHDPRFDWLQTAIVTLYVQIHADKIVLRTTAEERQYLLNLNVVFQGMRSNVVIHINQPRRVVSCSHKLEFDRKTHIHKKEEEVSARTAIVDFVPKLNTSVRKPRPVRRAV